MSTAAAPATAPPHIATPAQPPGADTAPALREALIATVAGQDPDLSLRQLAVLLVLATEPGPHLVRHLAARLAVPKPSITRAVDRLATLDLARRQDNPEDRRSPLLSATLAGRAYVRVLSGTLRAALEAR
jgi:DNA-binding MarR family transcriptional regulator